MGRSKAADDGAIGLLVRAFQHGNIGNTEKNNQSDEALVKTSPRKSYRQNRLELFKWPP